MRRTLLLALAALSLAAPLSAQSACAAKGPRLPSAGGWAEYRTARGDMRIAYLARETAGERLEIAATSQRGNMVMQMVVPGFPYEMGEIKEMVMQAEGQPAMRMPETMMGMMRGRMPRATQLSEASCARMIKVGDESITVAAGTFQTTHWRDSTGGTDVWVSPRVPFGTVKVVSGENSMELIGSGTGATTRITGPIGDMPGMPQGGGRPRGR
jgi:hypothetical protein